MQCAGASLSVTAVILEWEGGYRSNANVPLGHSQDNDLEPFYCFKSTEAEDSGRGRGKICSCLCQGALGAPLVPGAQSQR